jgi:exopolysaccharide biosynthesis polyprenyl glycosylphosphotransferase
MRLDQRGIKLCRAVIDFLVVLIGFGLSLRIYNQWRHGGTWTQEPGIEITYFEVAVLFGAICVAVFWSLDLYRERASVLNLREYETAVKGVLMAAAIFFAILFLFKLGGYSRFVVIGGLLFSTLLVLLARRSVSTFFNALDVKGRLGRNVLIYGCGQTGKLLMKKLLHAPHRGCRVVGFIDDFAPRGAIITCTLDQTMPSDLFRARILGRLRDLPALVKEHEIDEMLVTVPLTNSERHRAIIRLARELSIEVGIVPRVGELRADLLDVEDLSAIPVVRPSLAQRRGIYLVVKRVFDLTVATTLLILTAPLWVVAAVAIKVESPGPVFFRQKRRGLRGKEIEILKFRTMYEDVSPYERSPGGDVDLRITRVGRFLRMGGFDELPQIVNVFRGEMSVVGPRPEMPFIVDGYSPLEHQRLVVKPGITGIWQLSSDRHSEIHENLEYDLYYIRHQSLLMDVLILFETLFFTIGLVPRRMSRRRVVPHLNTVLPDSTPADDTLKQPVAGDGYVVAALDQRVDGALPQSWLTCMPALYELAGANQTVKILVAPDNVTAFDHLADEPQSGKERDETHIEYIPYTSRSELRAVTLGAKLVLTDLRHVQQWAGEAGKDVVFVEGDSVKWQPGGSGTSDIANHLLPLLPALQIGEQSLREVS